jgi:hypothetical protein
LYINHYALGRSLQTTCPSPLWVWIPRGILDFFIWGSYPASLRNVSGSTWVPISAWNNARKGTWGRPPPVKLERRNMTYTVSLWHKTQSNKHYFFDRWYDRASTVVCNITLA